MLPIRDLRTRLGPEGRLIYDKMSLENQPENKTYEVTTNISKSSFELDHLFKELVHPNASLTPEKVLSYLAYYYLKIKNTANVQLLTEYFLQCPLFFNNGQVVELSQATRIIECFQFVVEKKYQVSEPTVPFHSFYRSVFTGIRNVLCSGPIFMNSWKVSPVIVGCLLAKRSRIAYDPYPQYLEAIREVDSKLLETFENCAICSQSFQLNKDLVYMELICLACVQEHVSTHTLVEILRHKPDLPLDIVVLVFNSPYGFHNGRAIAEKLQDWTAIPYLSILSRLFCLLLSVHPDHSAVIKCIDSSLNRCRNYSVALFDLMHASHLTPSNPESQTWRLLKQNFFTLISMFEGISRFIYSQCSIADVEFCCRFSTKILDSLLYTNFISEAIGTGGFDTYTFVHNVSLDCLKNKDKLAAGLLVKTWVGSLQSIDPTMGTDYMVRSKILFWLNFSESCIDILPREIRLHTVLPMARQLVSNSPSQDVLEGAHSVMLRYFELLRDPSESSAGPQTKKTLHDYLELTIAQFPSKLSLKQTGVVVDTIARTVSPGSALFDTDRTSCAEFFTLLFRNCMHSSNEHFEEAETSHFKHRQPALTSMLIQVTPLIPEADYIGWMQKIKSSLVDPVVDSEEKQALLDKLWDSVLVANKYYPDKGQAGIRWWYQSVVAEDAKL